ncbi:hypothetical protein D9615_010625 [Tricholomella constricta]|uniref:Uncharacterized protein n=1 Tax=Tricholomella constricta TaxID=117010 RepID=A0A8H5GL24_9AGAR|nr:hypothetical protein D9615_010625 [Tricholomella constricta]
MTLAEEHAPQERLTCHTHRLHPPDPSAVPQTTLGCTFDADGAEHADHAGRASEDMWPNMVHLVPRGKRVDGVKSGKSLVRSARFLLSLMHHSPHSPGGADYAERAIKEGHVTRRATTKVTSLRRPKIAAHPASALSHTATHPNLVAYRFPLALQYRRSARNSGSPDAAIIQHKFSALSLKLEKFLAQLLVDGTEEDPTDPLEDKAMRMAVEEIFEETGRRWKPWTASATQRARWANPWTSSSSNTSRTASTSASRSGAPAARSRLSSGTTPSCAGRPCRTLPSSTPTLPPPPVPVHRHQTQTKPQMRPKTSIKAPESDLQPVSELEDNTTLAFAVFALRDLKGMKRSCWAGKGRRERRASVCWWARTAGGGSGYRKFAREQAPPPSSQPPPPRSRSRSILPTTTTMTLAATAGTASPQPHSDPVPPPTPLSQPLAQTLPPLPPPPPPLTASPSASFARLSQPGQVQRVEGPAGGANAAGHDEAGPGAVEVMGAMGDARGVHAACEEVA